MNLNYDHSEFEIDGTTLIRYTGNKPQVLIPEGVISIGEEAFADCKSLASVTIPDSVTSIGEAAFVGCDSLTSVTIPDGVTSIGDNAFVGCTSLTSVTIPDSVTSIGDYAFCNCSSLTSVDIPDGVTSIGRRAFSGCKSLISLTIGSGVTSIGDQAFCDCSLLTSITIDSGNTVYHSSGNCIIETASKTLVVGCKNSAIPTDGSVTSIGDNAFLGCTSLTSITIPDSVTSIGNDAFRACISLTSMTIPDSVTFIGSAFIDCKSLTNVNIPKGVTSISSCTFLCCKSLTSVVIPNSVTSIGESAFSSCASLINVTIPDSVTSIGDYAFWRCSSLTSVTIPDGVTSIGVSAFDDGILLIRMTQEEQNQYDELVKLEQDSKFKKLCKMLEGDNLLSFFEIEKQETKHSRALAKLFNPSDYYWEGQFIEYLVTKAELGIIINDYSSFEVQTEYFIPANNNMPQGYIDILLYSESESVVIVIENKIDSGEHSNQLQRYYDWIEKNDPKFKSYKTKCYIFLTKTGKAASHKNWKSFSYKQIIDMLEEIVPTLSSCSVEMKSILNQYKQFIRRNIAMDKKLENLYLELVKNYPNAVRGLVGYISSKIYAANIAVSNEINNVLKDLERKNVVYDINCSQGGITSKGGYTFTFRTVNLKNRINLSGANPVLYKIMPETNILSNEIKDNFYVCYGEYDNSCFVASSIKQKVYTAFGKATTIDKIRLMGQNKRDGIHLSDCYDEKKGALKKDATSKIEDILKKFLDGAKKYEDKYQP